MNEELEVAEEIEKKNFLREILPYVIIVIVVVLIRTYIITPVQVDGTSMAPNLENNEILLLKKFDKSYDRFDVVVFDHNGDKLIKRIIGLPGETIEYKDNKLYINGSVVRENFERNSETYDFNIKEIGYTSVPAGHYFVMGDNRNNSTDSRIIGPISTNQIDGVTNFSLFPFNTFGKIA